jgi:hypothetical protein
VPPVYVEMQQSISWHMAQPTPTTQPLPSEPLLPVCHAADLLGDLHFLCHANVPPPAPPPWQDSYQLLKGGLDTLASRADSAAAAAAAAAVASRLDLQW